MSISVKVHFHPIFELMNSMLIFSSPSFYKKTEMGHKWRKSVQKKLSNDLVKELDSVVTKSFELICTYLFTHPDTHADVTINAVLDELLEMGPSEMSILVEKQINPSKELPKCEQESFEKTILLIRQWNNEYFNQLDPIILQSLEDDYTDKLQQLPHFEPLDFVEKVTKGFVLKDFVDLKQIILYPSYHTNPLVTFTHFPDLHTYCYPVDLPPLSPDEPTPSLLQKGIALSDKNRLKILRFLGKEEKSFTEIVKYIGLAKSTVHHHMVLLRSSGLVQIIISPSSTERYRLREQGFENIHQDYYQYLFSHQL